MVLNLVKSPLVRSIGGVGAIAAVLIGASYLATASDPDSTPDQTTNQLSVSPWQQGTDLGWQAAVEAQTAKTQADWQRVSDLWDQAIATLEAVPPSDANYAQAQAKAAQYRGNRAIARDRLAKASPSPSTATSALQTALAAAKPSFTFSSDAANRTVGQSADGLATVELTGDRATLVLPRSPQNKALTMAQVVYANQFLTLAAPETATQPWLLEGLRDVQRNQPPTLPADAPVIFSTAPESLTITVMTEP